MSCWMPACTGMTPGRRGLIAHCSSKQQRAPCEPNCRVFVGLDSPNKSVHTPNMDTGEVDFTATRQCVCTAARRRSRELTRAFEKAMRGAGLRGTQFTLLATLIQTGSLPTTRLAEFLGLERTTLTRNLGPLLRHGYVRSRGRPGSPGSQGKDHIGREGSRPPGLSLLEEGAGRRFGGSRRRTSPKLKNFRYACSYTLMEVLMFDILSTAELTIGAAIVVGFLSLTMA